MCFEALSPSIYKDTEVSMNLKTYDAIAHREGTGWVVDVPELETAGQPTNFSGILLAAT